MTLPEYKTPSEALQAGYISITEALKRKPGDRTTFYRQGLAGEIPACWTYKASRQVMWILAKALQSAELSTGKRTYQSLEKLFLDQMISGSFSGKQSSEKYVSDTLDWGLKKYWQLLGEEPSIADLNSRNFDKVMDHPSLAVDFGTRRDYFSTRKHIYMGCTRFIDFLIKEGLKAESDRKAFTRPKKHFKSQKRMLEEEEIDEVIKFNRGWLYGRRYYDMEVADLLIHLYAFTGLRLHEALSLKIENIDFKSNRMLVYRKGGKEGFVRIDLFPQLKERLLSWLNTDRPFSKEGLLVTQGNGEPYTKGAINRRFQRLNDAYNLFRAFKILASDHSLSKQERVQKAEEMATGMKNVARPHDFRRSFATIMANRGMPMSMIQLLLAHEDLQTTQGYVMTNLSHVMAWNDTDSSILKLPSKAAAPTTSELATINDEVFSYLEKMN